MRLALVLAFAALIAGLILTTPVVALAGPTAILAILVAASSRPAAPAAEASLPPLRTQPELANLTWLV